MLNSILLQAAGSAGAQGGASGWSSIIMIVALIAIFYFFMIRPQSKKQKEIKKFRDAMKKGVVKYNKADILMHDSGVSKNTTVQALPKLIEYLRSQGYAIEPITQDTLPIQHIR